MYLVHMSVMCCSFSRPIAFGVYDVREESSSELPASLLIGDLENCPVYNFSRTFIIVPDGLLTIRKSCSLRMPGTSLYFVLR